MFHSFVLGSPARRCSPAATLFKHLHRQRAAGLGFRRRPPWGAAPNPNY